MWANFLIGANGATTLSGSSSALSSPRDRERFHALRSQVRAIVIGGNTFRGEPYRKSLLPLYVATRSTNDELKARNPEAIFLHLSPREITQRALQEAGAPILIEAGANFISPLLRETLINRLFLTRSNRDGDGDFYAIDDDLSSYQLTGVEEFPEERFEIWEPR